MSQAGQALSGIGGMLSSAFDRVLGGMGGNKFGLTGSILAGALGGGGMGISNIFSNLGSLIGGQPAAAAQTPGSRPADAAQEAQQPQSGGAPADVSAQGAAQSGQIMSKAQVKEAALRAGFSPSEAAIVVGIAGGESGRDPSNSTKRSGLYARTGEDSVGLMQINWGYHKNRGWLQSLGINSREQLFDPATNLKAAHYLYKQRGNFHDWTVYTKGIYKGNMQTGGPIKKQTGGMVNMSSKLGNIMSSL